MNAPPSMPSRKVFPADMPALLAPVAAACRQQHCNQCVLQRFFCRARLHTLFELDGMSSGHFAIRKAERRNRETAKVLMWEAQGVQESLL